MLLPIGCGFPTPNQKARSVEVPDATTKGAVTTNERPATSSTPTLANFASSPVADAAARSIQLSDGSTVSLRSRKIDAKQGISDARCEVLIGAQRIATIGGGEQASVLAKRPAQEPRVRQAKAPGFVGGLGDADAGAGQDWRLPVAREQREGWDVHRQAVHCAGDAERRA